MASFRFLNDHELAIALDPAIPVAEAAEIVNRTKNGIWAMRKKAREGTLTLRSSWSDAEIEFLISNPYMTAKQISGHTGRTESAVAQMKLKLAREQGVEFHRGSKSPMSVGQRPLLAKTCADCGMFLGAEWFRETVSRSIRMNWASSCKKCASERAERFQRREGRLGDNSRKYQEVSVHYAHNNGQEYTDADYDILQREDMSLLEKAIAMGRTYAAVSGAVQKFNLQVKHRLGEPQESEWKIFFDSAQREAS